MKILTLKIPDSKFSFFTELIKQFSFVKLVKTEEAGQNESGDDENEWKEISTSGISNAYGSNEPDYDSLHLKEPNPGYKRETR